MPELAHDNPLRAPTRSFAEEEGRVASVIALFDRSSLLIPRRGWPVGGEVECTLCAAAFVREVLSYGSVSGCVRSF